MGSEHEGNVACETSPQYLFPPVTIPAIITNRKYSNVVAALHYTLSVHTAHSAIVSTCMDHCYSNIKLLVTGCFRYRQRFDVEGESGIVVRAIGTIAYLAHSSPSPTTVPISLGIHESPSPQLTPTEAASGCDDIRYCTVHVYIE